MPTTHSIFTGRMLFLMPNEQCQSTEGNPCVYNNRNLLTSVDAECYQKSLGKVWESVLSRKWSPCREFWQLSSAVIFCNVNSLLPISELRQLVRQRNDELG